MTRATPLPTPRSFWLDDDCVAEPHVTITVHLPDDTPVDTGLVDEHGTPIMRVPSRHPVGFCR